MNEYSSLSDIELMSVREELEFYLANSKQELNKVLLEINKRVDAYKKLKEKEVSSKETTT